MNFPYLQKSISEKEEVLFSINVKKDLDYNLLNRAFKQVLNEEVEEKRRYYLIQILGGLLAKGPTLIEITAILDSIFEFDNFDVYNREYIKSDKPILTVAGSGKKGIKTVNMTSMAAFTASAAGVKIAKLCSPSTSSSTGSQDLISILSNRNDWTRFDSAEHLNTVGIGFFPVEDVLPRFASIYSGVFYAPHALSFALAALATRYQTEHLLYGLSHPNVELSVELFRHYKIPNAMTVTSTKDSILYMDEALSIGATYLYGYRSLDEEPKGKATLHLSEVIPGDGKPVFEKIAQEKDPIQNVIKGLSGLTGRNLVLQKEFAINSALMMFMSEGGSFIDQYNRSVKVIESGEPIRQITKYIKSIDGDINNLEKLIDESLKL